MSGIECYVVSIKSGGKKENEKTIFHSVIFTGRPHNLRVACPIGPVKQSFFCLGDLPDRLGETAKRRPQQKEML